MINDVKNTKLALEVLGIPNRIRDLENRPVTFSSGKSDTSNLVPYTGATSDVDLGTNDLTAENLIATGTGESNIDGGLLLGAGTSLQAPLTLTAGTNLATPKAGTIEFDGTNFYVSI